MAEHAIAYHDPNALVQTDWLEAHLGDTNLRIFDCTTHLLPAEADTDAPYRIVSGKADYDAGHIPGAGFLDLQGELWFPGRVGARSYLADRDGLNGEYQLFLRAQDHRRGLASKNLRLHFRTT